MIALERGVIDAASYLTVSTVVTGVCVVGVAVVVLLAVLAWPGRTATRPAGRHRRSTRRRLLPADTQVSAMVEDRAWCGVVEQPRTGTDRRSGVFPVRFPFGVRLMCADDVTVTIDAPPVGAR